jgi:hypothetical protein
VTTHARRSTAEWTLSACGAYRERPGTQSMMAEDDSYSCLRCRRVSRGRGSIVRPPEQPADAPPGPATLREARGPGLVPIPSASYQIQPGVWMAECPFLGRIVKHGRSREEAEEKLAEHAREIASSTRQFPGKDMRFFNLEVPGDGTEKTTSGRLMVSGAGASGEARKSSPGPYSGD